MEARCPICGEMYKILSSQMVMEDGENYRVVLRGCLNKGCANFKKIAVENKTKISG